MKPDWIWIWIWILKIIWIWIWISQISEPIQPVAIPTLMLLEKVSFSTFALQISQLNLTKILFFYIIIQNKQIAKKLLKSYLISAIVFFLTV